MSERCPACESENITGRAFDLSGDELQERYCYDCGLGESAVRSRGGVSWTPREIREHRGFTADGIERTLRDEIDAAPGDDGPRSIYADWLIERADPLGTFIVLQLARVARREPTASADEQALLDTHWREWIGAPSRLGRERVAFTRGFWSAADLTGLRRIDPALLEHPAWSTVSRLSIGAPIEAQLPIALASTRRSLRRLAVSSTAAMNIVCESGIAIEELVLEADNVTPPLTALAALPKLRSFGVHCIGEFGAGWVERVGRARVPELVLVTSPQIDDLRAILRAAQASELHRVTIDVRSRYAFHADRDRDGSFAIRRVEIQSTTGLVDTFANLSRSLAAIAKHVDAGVKLTMESITPEHAQLADAHGLKLVQMATRFAAMPQ